MLFIVKLVLCSCQLFLNHLRFGIDPGQPHVYPLPFGRELFVIKAEQTQDRGVEIAHVDGVFHDVIAEFVRLADHHTAFHPPAGQPHRETTRTMVASVKGSHTFVCSHRLAASHRRLAA